MARIFFGGAEKPEVVRDLINNGVENLHLSYYYLLRRETGWPEIRRMLQANPKVKVFLNSGAYTYQSARATSLPPPERYYSQYLEFVSVYRTYFEYVAEFDIDGIWDAATLDKQREKLWELKANVVPIWHVERGMDAWKSYLDDPRVKCVGLSPDKKHGHLNFAKHTSMALIAGKNVHGVSMTKLQTTLKHVKFTSVDSSSWHAGDRYGDLYVFQWNKWTLLNSHDKDERKKYRQYFKSIGCDPKKILDGDVNEIRKANIIAWARMAKRLELIHQFRGNNHTVRDRETGEPVAAPEGDREVDDLGRKLFVQGGKIFIKKGAFRGVKEKDLAPQSVRPPAAAPDPAPTIVGPKDTPAPAAGVAVAAQTPGMTSLTRYEESGGFGFSAVMPKFACSTCSLAADCPQYREGYVCAFTDKFSSFGTRDMGEIRELMRRVVQQNALRLQRGLLMEEVAMGGQIDKDVTRLSTLVMQQAKELAELESTGNGLKITANGRGVSLLASLFSRPKPVDEHEEEVIDVTSEKEASNG